MSRYDRVPPKRVHGMGRVKCACCNLFVWDIQYKKGEHTYEDDYGVKHPSFTPEEKETETNGKAD